MSTAYASEVSRQSEFRAVKRTAHQDIGPPPPCVNPERRARAKDSLRVHLEEYHAQTFSCPWATYHYALIEMIENVIKNGGWFAMAVPRGGGKSSIAEGAAEWAVLHGHKRFPVLVGATAPKSESRLKNIKVELRYNDILFEDFPEVCHPIRCLKGSSHSAAKQHINGRMTDIEWQKDHIALPMVDGSVASGSRIACVGLTGDVRGISEKTSALESLRPDFAIPDDPQTRDSAKSFTQSQNRFAIITGDIAYLNGPGKKMSVVMPCTVIYRGDMADQVLDPNLNPEWQSERHRMVVSFPDRMDMWDEYAEMRREAKRLKVDIEPANEFYRTHREAMDAGSEVTWPSRYNEDEDSAIQHAMNLKIRDETAFAAECQNEPAEDSNLVDIIALPNEIIVKQSHLPSMEVPQYATKIAFHVDVQQTLLYYAVVAVSDSFEASVIDYGTYPDQGRTYFSLSDSLKTIQHEFSTESRLETQVYLAIRKATDALMGRQYVREDGLIMQTDLGLADGRWLKETVYQAVRESPHAQKLRPMIGFGVKATDKALHERKRTPGETRGHYWLEKRDGAQKTIHADVNYWKSQVHRGFKASLTAPGCLTLFKVRPERHRMIAEHCNAEYPTRVSAKNREVDEWSIKPTNPDNHGFDNIVGCLVGASVLGCKLPNAHDNADEGSRRRRKFSKDGVGYA